MQYSVVAILALAGAAIASPAAQSTVTAYSTQVVTLTECPATVTNCPARTSTIVNTMTYPAGAAAGTGNPGAAYATGTGAYVKPTLSGYSGPAYTGAAGQVKAAGALAGVGAFAALLLDII
ncbi:hypothetical protein K461DRAFT_313937 [Myriangium duriaei CBS 260.36]|uniref:Uncharacterized protein n=1 Tax=Myriangium duriaei CBS 260.36 TaxID=1168546 RepID=A0A9P4IYH1_9PEZI|nr:hypothetical protein K461DRAFT_313937 [Myriangium duriaei CBS 260.36]